MKTQHKPLFKNPSGIAADAPEWQCSIDYARGQWAFYRRCHHEGNSTFRNLWARHYAYLRGWCPEGNLFAWTP